MTRIDSGQRRYIVCNPAAAEMRFHILTNGGNDFGEIFGAFHWAPHIFKAAVAFWVRSRSQNQTRSQGRNALTYCLGILLPAGLVLASDSRSNAGVDQVARVRKLARITVPNNRVIA